MRKLIALLLIFLMLLQAIPVLHFFSSHKAVFYSYVDEEKPEQKFKAANQEYQKHSTAIPPFFIEEESSRTFLPFVVKRISSPLLEALTRPPDAC